MAAQGLAIALAEDTLSQPGSVSAADEGKSRQKLAGHALGIFSRINDCLLDGSGNVNMGHCHFTRGDEEKAIQAVSFRPCSSSSSVCLEISLTSSMKLL
jgi:RNA polymerase-associated protein CTR9